MFITLMIIVITWNVTGTSGESAVGRDNIMPQSETWSQRFRNLRITEIMHDPLPGDGFRRGDYEFIELWNQGDSALEIGGISFSDGISLTLSSELRLAPNAFLMLAKEPEAFRERYGFQPDNRVGYGGQLNNAGERIALQDATGNEIIALNYDDDAEWLGLADRGGFSLVPVDPTIVPAASADWRVSQEQYGSPGRIDPALSFVTAGPIKVNEVLAHTDLPQTDYIELYNPTAEYADISGWYITDDLANLRRFRVPFGTEISPYGYLTFDEDVLGFAFFSEGDGAFLIGASITGTLTGYMHGFDFGVTPNGVSLGRCTIPDNEADTEDRFVLQDSISPDGPNDRPLIGPIVISEIYYAPLTSVMPNQYEFIELTNITTRTVPLYDPANPENLWQISGIGTFTLTTNVEIPAGGTMLITNAAPELFRSHYNIRDDVEIQGPFGGQLRDSGERISLRRPDEPNLEGTTPYIDVDAVDYQSDTPWPSLVGSGLSLERVVLNAYGNSWTNWQASRTAGGTPGISDGRIRVSLRRDEVDYRHLNSVFLPLVARQPTPANESCFYSSGS